MAISPGLIRAYLCPYGKKGQKVHFLASVHFFTFFSFLVDRAHPRFKSNIEVFGRWLIYVPKPPLLLVSIGPNRAFLGLFRVLLAIWVNMPISSRAKQYVLG